MGLGGIWQATGCYSPLHGGRSRLSAEPLGVAGAMPYFLAVWLAIALAFTGFGGLHLYPAPFPPLILVSLVALLLVGYASISPFRSAVQALTIEWLVGFHVTRFVGFYFLALYEQGHLPYAFAVLGGWGDILIAAAAAVLLSLNRRWRIPFRVWQVWNVLGLLDILFVVFTAARSGWVDPGSIAPLLQLPLGLLPTFLVPIILFTHLLLLGRFGSARAARAD